MRDAPVDYFMSEYKNIILASMPDTEKWWTRHPFDFFSYAISTLEKFLVDHADDQTACFDMADATLSEIRMLCRIRKRYFEEVEKNGNAIERFKQGAENGSAA